jgi:hypothetical protein
MTKLDCGPCLLSPLVVLLKEIFSFFTTIVQASFVFDEIFIVLANIGLLQFGGSNYSSVTSSSSQSTHLALVYELSGSSTS